MVRPRILLLWAAALLYAGAAQAAQFTASVDRAQVAADGYVLLTLKLINSDTRLRARGVEPNVDLTLLSDAFTIGVPKTLNRFNLYRGQGRSTSELEVELFPKHTGTLTVPPFTVDGLSTKPIPILVVHAVPHPTPDVFVKSGVTRRTVWQRQQTIAYLDLYYRVDLKDARLGEHVDTDPLDADLDKLPQADRKESIGAFTYHVQRIGWALMPVDSGRLTVTLPELWAETAAGGKFHANRHTEVITVKALPAGVPSLTIVGRPVVAQDLTRHAAQVDKLLSWTITLKAATALGSLPQSLPMGGLPDQVKFYYDRPLLHKDVRTDGMIAVAEYSVSAIPLRPGTVTIPAVEVPYFDPVTGTMASATQPAVTLDVTAAPAPPSAAAPPAAAPAPAARATAAWWPAAALVFAVLWLATLILALALAVRRRPAAAAPAARRRAPPRRDDRPLRRALLAALDSVTLEEGLIEFERRHGRDEAVRRAVREVQALCYGPHRREGDARLSAAVDEAVERIQRAAATGAAPPDPWSPRSFSPAVPR